MTKKDTAGYTKKRHREMMYEVLDHPKRKDNIIKISKILGNDVTSNDKKVSLSSLLKTLGMTR